jgi:hypothetical protein
MRKLTLVSISDLRQSEEQRLLYDPPSDSEIEELAESIKKRGLLHEPVITQDKVIISGHRRVSACLQLGKESIRCKTEPITYKKNKRRFLKMLREANRQRVKKTNEVIQEAIVDSSDHADADRVYMAKVLNAHVDLEAMEIEGEKKRFQIKGNKPLLDAAVKVINELRDYWPLSDRQIHYKLLNDPSLKNRNKPDSVYRNDASSYHLLTNVLTRGRLFGVIPWESIGDETRPFTQWIVHPNPSSFINAELNGFLKGYFRDYMQSQPNRIEIVGEKLTLNSIIKPIAMKYCIPYTIGRGYASINPRHDMAERYRASGKMKLVVLILSDLDPDGDEIAQSFARSMRDDFDIDRIHPIKIALTWQQITDLNLPSSPDRKAKTGSKNYGKYFDRYGSDDVWELEALSPQQLQTYLDEAIKSVIHIDLFNEEIQREGRDERELKEYRKKVFTVIQNEKRI